MGTAGSFDSDVCRDQVRLVLLGLFGLGGVGRGGGLVLDGLDDGVSVLDLGVGCLGLDGLDDVLLGGSSCRRSPSMPSTRRARSASEVTVFSLTSSMIAIGALSPLRGIVLMMRV